MKTRHSVTTMITSQQMSFCISTQQNYSHSERITENTSLQRQVEKNYMK